MGQDVENGTARRASVPQTAMAAPTAAPSNASRTFSVSSRRRMRHGPAPRARRTPISRWRVLALASMRLAVFPQTARSSRSINPCRIHSARASMRWGSAQGLPERKDLGLHAPRSCPGRGGASSLIAASSSACARARVACGGRDPRSA